MKKHITIILTGMLMVTWGFSFAQDSTIIKEIEQLKRQNQTLSEQINKLKPGINQFRMTGFANITYHQGL